MSDTTPTKRICLPCWVATNLELPELHGECIARRCSRPCGCPCREEDR